MSFSLILKRPFAVLALMAALLTGAPVAAADNPAPLATADQALVDQAAGYLQAMNEMRGRFEQTDAHGAVTHGDLYLKRPGLARFAYDPPSNLLVISNGKAVSVVDPRLKTLNSYPLWATPLSLLLARQVRLDRGVSVSRVDRFSDGFAITAHDARRRTRGELTLTFASDPVRLREWSMTDGQGQTTRVKLLTLEPASGLPSTLFVAPDPYAIRKDADAH